MDGQYSQNILQHKMSTYRYLIYSRSDNDYTAELTNEHILYKQEQIYKPTLYMCQSDNYGIVFDGGDFLIKCVDQYGVVLFTTSYRQIKNNITATYGREKIGQLYNILENKRCEHMYENMVGQMANTTI